LAAGRRRRDVDNLGFLLAKASQRWNQRLTAGLTAAGFPQVRASYGSVLLPLWEQHGVRMGALAERARLSKQTMTTLVRLAERDGLVERRADPADRRAARVWLTPAAVALAPVAAAVVAQLQSQVETALGARATRGLHHGLTALTSL
jgi:MarR family transcriptional regulator, transcriptional regulator for hemolysin